MYQEIISFDPPSFRLHDDLSHKDEILSFRDLREIGAISVIALVVSLHREED